MVKRRLKNKRQPLKYQTHKEKWQGCELCEYHECRNRMVLLRGMVPCDVLFIGEAPGGSEDLLGQPFVGPAGIFLDELIEKAIEKAGVDPPRLAFTNLVACIPKLDPAEGKIGAPDKKAIMACKDRLVEVIDLCQPNKLIAVGDLSKKYLPKIVKENHPSYATITHPAAILRAGGQSQGYMIQRTILEIVEVFENLF